MTERGLKILAQENKGMILDQRQASEQKPDPHATEEDTALILGRLLLNYTNARIELEKFLGQHPLLRVTLSELNPITEIR